MDENTEKKIDRFHMLLGLVAGFVSGFTGPNGGFFGIIILYSGFFLTRIIFSLERTEFTLNIWLSKGVVSFLMIWLPVWIFLFNL